MVDIVHRVGMKSSVGEVYKALATREGAAAWWTIDTKGESKVGGRLEFSFSADGRHLGGFDMKVLELIPGDARALGSARRTRRMDRHKDQF